MYSKHYQSTKDDYSNYMSLRQTPELQQKIYSFKDPLYESFGNGYLSKANLPYTKNVGHKKQTDHINRRNADTEDLQEALELSHTFKLMKNMLKISKPICSASMLLINSKNKIKAEMIVESNSKNEDEDSKISCENAKKYLTFLEVLKQEQQKYPFAEKRVQTNQIDVKINLESRIQNRTLPFSNQSQSFNTSHHHEKEMISKSSNFNASYLKYEQKVSENNFDHSFAHDSSLASKQEEYLSNQEYSKYLASHEKGSQMIHNSENTDKMFQKIQTPKIYQNNPNQELYFTPFQQNLSQKQDQRERIPLQRKFRKFEKSPPKSSAVLQTKNLKTNSNLSRRENIHNQKAHRQFKIEEEKSLKKQISIKKGLSKSSNQKSKSVVSHHKEKKLTQAVSKTGKYKITIGKNLNIQEKSKNLAMKVMDKTSQFQKMLKMTSQRTNPT